MKRAARPLLYAGILAIVFGLARIHSGREGYDLTDSFRFSWTITYCVLLGVAAYGSGIPDLPRTWRQAATSTVLAVGAAVLGISLLQLVSGSALLPRFVVFGSMVPVAAWALVCTALANGGRVRSEQRDRIVLVSGPGEAAALRDELAASPERPGVLLDHLSLAEAAAVGERSRPLVERVVAVGANVLVLDRSAIDEPAVVEQAAALHEAGLRVRTLSLFYDEWLGKLPLSELERASLLFDIRELHGPRYLRAKRGLDVLLGAVACLALVVAVPVVFVANLAGNRGALLYRQPRVGKLGRHFTILKFRTMRSSTDAEGPSWTQRSDPRITPFGRILRVSHLDELPQAINVLRGDLSIVGPRPEQPHYVAELVEKLPFYDMRHLVRPGLTGWAQVKYGYAGDESDALEKLQYEFWYLSHQSLGLDARIVGRTVRSVLGGEGAGR